MLSKNNFCHQRQAIKKSLEWDDEAYKKMVIPFLGMIMKDLEKYDQLPNLEDGSINKRKYLKVAKYISDLIAQIKFKPSNTVRYEPIWEHLEKLYKRVEKLMSVDGCCKWLNDKADHYVKIEQSAISFIQTD